MTTSTYKGHLKLVVLNKKTIIVHIDLPCPSNTATSAAPVTPSISTTLSSWFMRREEYGLHPLFVFVAYSIWSIIHQLHEYLLDALIW